jgi:hypothetical protein
MLARRLLLLGAVSGVLAAACGGSTDGVQGTPPAPSADPSPQPAAPAPPSSPEDVARAYVDAINAHDGETVCGLMLESAAYQFRVPGWGECPKFISAYIGYGEESDTNTFHRARILDLTSGERQGELRSLRMSVEVEQNEQGNELNRRTVTYDDVLWLVEREGRWRLAKASGLLYVAFAAYQVPDDLLEAPDLTAQEREYEHATAAEQEREELGLRDPDSVFDCAGGATTYDDANSDLYVQGSTELNRRQARRYAAADIGRVEVATENDDLCVRVTVGRGDIEERLVIQLRIYSPDMMNSLGAQLELNVDVRPDGRARLVYEDPSEEDDYGRHPLIPIPGELGRDGNTFSIRVSRADLMEVMGDGASELPEWNSLLWGGMTFYLTEIDGNRRAVSDDVPDRFAMISHPGGQVFDAQERQERDLPTG